MAEPIQIQKDSYILEVVPAPGGIFVILRVQSGGHAIRLSPNEARELARGIVQLVEGQ